MPKLWCSTIECVHNKKNRCTAKEVNLSDGRVHTTHNGYMQYWECRSYEISERAKFIEAEIKKIFLGMEQRRKSNEQK